MFRLCSCIVNFGNTTDPTKNTEPWINLVYNKGWKKYFLGSPLDEDFPFESQVKKEWLEKIC